MSSDPSNKTTNTLVHRKATAKQPAPRKSFFRTIGVLFGLLRDYTAEDLNRLKEAGVRIAEAKARHAHAKADTQLAEALQKVAAAEKTLAEASAVSQEKRETDAIRRVSDAISIIRQNGGNVAFDSAQLQYLLERSESEDQDRRVVDVDQGPPAEAAPGVEEGNIIEGKVVSVKDFGAFVEIGPDVIGLCHISELDQGYVRDVSEICKVGDTITVKVLKVDDTGRIKLSRKALL